MVVEDVVIIGGARTPFCEWQGGKEEMAFLVVY